MVTIGCGFITSFCRLQSFFLQPSIISYDIQPLGIALSYDIKLWWYSEYENEKGGVELNVLVNHNTRYECAITSSLIYPIRIHWGLWTCIRGLSEEYGIVISIECDLSPVIWHCNGII